MITLTKDQAFELKMLRERLQAEVSSEVEEARRRAAEQSSRLYRTSMSKATDRILSGANEAVRKLNPHVFGHSSQMKSQISQLGGMSKIIEGHRLRQETKPLMNKLESDWFENLKRTDGVVNSTLRAQSKRFKLGNGAWYKPDMTALVKTGSLTKETAWECKGPKQMKGVAKGVMTIKVAASQYPEIEFRLVWREAGRWCQQIVLP